MPTGLVTIKEGETELRVPKDSLTKREPVTSPVFFNPAARVNRDISVALTGELPGTTFCDVLAGMGARGVRIANEVTRRLHVTLNDFNASSLALAKESAKLNHFSSRCSFSHDEANHFLYSRFGRDEKFDLIDLDPFGTPAPFLEAAFSASSRESIVSVTATDATVLCGVYPKVALRRYGSVSQRSDFEHETALRILIHHCCRVAASQDIGIEPIACHSTRHYLRVYLRTRRSSTSADRSVRQAGHVAQCWRCGELTASVEAPSRCKACGEKVQAAGPVWTGQLTDSKILERAARSANRLAFAEAGSILTGLLGVDGYPPYSHDLERICSRLKISSVSHLGVLDSLSSQGYKAMKQPFEKRGLKTEASSAELTEIVKRLSSLLPQTHEVQL